VIHQAGRRLFVVCAGSIDPTTGAFESRFEQDAGRLADLAVGDADGYVRVLSEVVNDTLTADYWAITLPNELATSASKSPALLAYIAALNILDADALLSTGKVGSRLDPAITARKGIERHHIFPRAYLKRRLGITDSKEINQIANMALVEWADNIAISDEAPPVYWPAQVAAKQITADRLGQQMYWHALPDEWEQLEFADFLRRRRLARCGPGPRSRHRRSPHHRGSATPATCRPARGCSSR
jgi:hypothetical protein